MKMVNCYTKEKHTTDFPLLDFNSKLKSKTQMLVPVFIKKKRRGSYKGPEYSDTAHQHWQPMTWILTQ